jgi:hypothetical protein
MSEPKLITHGGKTMNISQWAAELGIDRNAFLRRLQSCPDKAFHKGTLTRGGNRKATLHQHNGKSLTAIQWAAHLGISISAFKDRMKHKSARTFEPGNLRGKLITHGGRTMTAKQWASELGITAETFQTRFKRYPDKAFHKGTLHMGSKCRLYTANGKTQTIRAWAAEAGIKHRTLGSRLRRGMSIEQALTYKYERTQYVADVKPFDQINRPYFTLSNGGSLKQCCNSKTPAPSAHTPPGSSKTFSDHLLTGAPPRETDLQCKNATEV